jgi:hypothetical protein
MMNSKVKSTLLWIFAFLFTAFIAVYQRMTGPTYPMTGKITIENKLIKYKLIRTYGGSDDGPVSVLVPDTSITGEYQYMRVRSNDTWTAAPMKRVGNELMASIPHEPIAGKVMYHVTLIKGGQKYLLNEKPAIIRYKGAIPLGILICHIILIFSAMLFSTRTGLEVLFKGKYTWSYSWVTLITLVLGGLVLGPIVQKYSFNVYWSGWPFGKDLTDNKSLVAFIFWVIAIAIQFRNREKKVWSLVASIILLIVFLIPHSMLGSEYDFTKEKKTEISK